ncbi:YacL family protein [Cognaticolwellia beringensis]|nr:YacL family protein [Cognaticolwellia beringensis]
MQLFNRMGKIGFSENFQHEVYMEYQFIDDPITGGAIAKFSLDHEVIGPWLEVEVGTDTEKLAQLLSAMADIEAEKKLEVTITGNEYTVVFNRGDVTVQTNASMDGLEILPDSLIEEDIDFDQQDSSSCGREDFREILLSWAKFVNKK